MKETLMKALIFLRLVDGHDETLSLTNISLIIVITKLALLKNPSMVDISALLLALLNTNIKKLLNKDAAATQEKEQ